MKKLPHVLAIAALSIWILPNQSLAREWYEGGTLSSATPAQWKSASAENRLATCSDFIAKLWLEKKLTPSVQNSIKSMDDLKPFSVLLRSDIDQAVQGADDAPKIYEIASAAIILRGWIR